MSLHKFDEDYFENGIEKGISLYENYTWKPEISFPIANFIKKFFPGDSILDYGCAKGYVVRALRMINVIAFGYDISEYAIGHCESDVEPYLTTKKICVPPVDSCYIKDVLEHIPFDQIDEELSWIRSKCKRMFVVIPLGKNGRFRIPDYNRDITHTIAEDEEWWTLRLIKAGFTINEFHHTMKGVKDKWAKHKFGNGIYLLK